MVIAPLDGRAWEYVTLRDAMRLARLAGLPDEERTVVYLYMTRSTLKSIDEALGRRHNWARSVVLSAGARILARWQSDKYYGMWEVYAEMCRAA
jgi:hypothetical protein